MKRAEFCEQIKIYRYQLYIVAYAILKNEDDAQDAVCSAILKGYEHREQLKFLHKFKPWMITITRNEALHIKKKRLELPGDEKIESLLEPVRDHYNELWDCIQRLPEEFRLTIILFYYNELSLKDISRILNVPLGTVKSRLSRGKKLLKQALEEDVK